MKITEQQERIARMKYIDGNDIQDIAADLKTTERFINRELRRVRQLIVKVDALTSSDRFDCNTANEGEMRERCQRLGKSQEYADFCVEAFVNKRRRKELAIMYGYEESTVKRYKNIRKKELEGPGR